MSKAKATVKAKSAPSAEKKTAPKKAAPEKAAAAPAKKAAAAAKKSPSSVAVKAEVPAASAVDVAALQAELAERRATEALLRTEVDAGRNLLAEAHGLLDEARATRAANSARVEELQTELAAAQTEPKLAQATAKDRVDRAWATQTAAEELNEARVAGQRIKEGADKAAEAAKAEVKVLRAEIDRLRARLHEREPRPGTLPGIGDPTPPSVSTPAESKAAAPAKAAAQENKAAALAKAVTPVAAATPPLKAEENAPQKALPADETSKNSDEDKPGFWGRLFKGKTKDEE